MHYQSVKEKIWINFIKDGGYTTIKGPTPQEFLRTYERLHEAEEGPSSELLPLEIKSYLAELRIWVYYFGEECPFPGVDPAPAIKSDLLTRWRDPHHGMGNTPPGYTPQFGWCPKTGQPWFGIRYSAIKAYPALCGPGQEYISELSRLTPSFVLYYERLGLEGPLLLWPEFKFTYDIKAENRQQVFNCFRAFLQEWTSEHGAWTLAGGRRVPISKAFLEFKRRPTSPDQALPLPTGFDFDLAFPQTKSQLQASRVSDSLTFPPSHGTLAPLQAHSKRRLSVSPDESRRKRHAIARTGSGGYSQEAKEKLDENLITSMRLDGPQRRTRSGETHWENIRRQGLGFGSQSSLEVKEAPNERYVDGGINSVGWRSPRIKEESEEKVRMKREVKEEDDINNIVNLKRWPPSKRHDREGRHN